MTTPRSKQINDLFMEWAILETGFVESYTNLLTEDMSSVPDEVLTASQIWSMLGMQLTAARGPLVKALDNWMRADGLEPEDDNG